MKPFEFSPGEWVIVDELQILSTNGIRGSQSQHASQTRTVPKKCWGGDHWVNTYAMAKSFRTGEDAIVYIDQNQHLMT